jgi:hypothetical protein
VFRFYDRPLNSRFDKLDWKFMKNCWKAILSTVIILSNVNAFAANWYVFVQPRAEDALYFFDRDTLDRTNETVSIWIKTMYDRNIPRSDGIYAAAHRYIFYCQKRMIQTLQVSQYDRQWKFLKSVTELSYFAEAAPGTVSESLVAQVCSPRFPDDSGSLFYFRLTDQNLDRVAAELFRPITSKKDNAPK